MDASHKRKSPASNSPMSNELTPNQLKRLFPNASASCLRRNSDNHPAELSAGKVSKPNERLPLVEVFKREAAGKRSVSKGERYRVTFVIYAVRPRDWDNLAASCKQLQDAIVEDGWLPDDNWRVLEGAVVSAKAKTKSEERTEVRISRIC